MNSKDELVRNIAESCGVALEISTFFFEVFINRVSNRLKSGEIMHFMNFGYFHKRNCRIQLEKPSDSPIAKSYLVQLVIFSPDKKITNDLNSLHFLKIPNLKTLWVDDKDFQHSLRAGDFSPHLERDKLIKSFATKAEVIISSLRKDYDSELENELVIPLTFDLNFLIKSGQKNVPSKNIETENIKSIQKTNSKSKTNDVETSEEGLPWNYGTKFLDSNKELKDSKSDSKKVSDEKSKIDKNSERTKVIKDEIGKFLSQEDSKEEHDANDKTSMLKDFEPVPSHLSDKVEDTDLHDEYDTIKFTLSSTAENIDENKKSENKFTEVKPKTEAYGLRDKSNKINKGNLFTIKSESKNFLPVVALVSFVIIIGALIYFNFIREGNIETKKEAKFVEIEIPSTVNVIDRDFEFAITYPYNKTEGQIKITGYNPDIFFISEEKPIVTTEVKKEIKLEKTKINKEVTTAEIKQELPKENNIETTPDLTEQKVSRIFLHKNYYVVYIGSFKSSVEADREAEKYYRMGYNSLIEVLEIRGKGKEYKLSVGDFTSEEFAKQFLSKYIRE